NGEGNNVEWTTDKDLSPYFKEGENTLELIVFNTVDNSQYRADLEINIPLYCECTKKKTNTCNDEITKNPSCGIQSNVCQEKDWKGNCVVNLQNYVCRDSNFYQQRKSCETTKLVQCRNPSGVVKDISTCDQGVDYETLQMTQNEGNGSFNKSPTSFSLSTSGDDGRGRSSRRNYAVTFN
ncbi:conjugal transfer protein TraN, partial [Acinetobacter baumannii]